LDTGLIEWENYFASATAIEETVLCCFLEKYNRRTSKNYPTFHYKRLILSADLRVAEQMVLKWRRTRKGTASRNLC